jgi:cellulose synthase/poly-beta-1,6-N-acetylglucosamine synthase-like glycosyltransferase
MSISTVVAWLIAALPLLMLAIYTVEVVVGLRPLAQAVGGGETPRTVVLIPAHNEAAGIRAAILALRATTDPAIELLVVADNCTDDTAEQARGAGAGVVERNDQARRGKGYALAFGRDHLAAAPPPDCVVVLDADCTVEGAGVAALARAAVASGRALQSCYLQHPDLTATPIAQISNFAFLMKNLVRQRGMTRMGGVAAMTGTGMAIPWTLLANAPLANADLAEDMSLGVWLTQQGKPPQFMESVRVWSEAASGGALMTQRHRWERGFLTVARQKALPLVTQGVAGASRSRLWLGLHLMVPPLALLFAASGAALAVTLLLALVGASRLTAGALTIALAVGGIATIAAWSTVGRKQISGSALLRAPLYIATKLPLYRMMLHRGGSDGWIRTRRAGENEIP